MTLTSKVTGSRQVPRPPTSVTSAALALDSTTFSSEEGALFALPKDTMGVVPRLASFDPLERLVNAPRPKNIARMASLDAMYATCGSVSILTRVLPFVKESALELVYAALSMQLSHWLNNVADPSRKVPGGSSSDGSGSLFSFFIVQQSTNIITRFRDVWKKEARDNMSAVKQVHGRLMSDFGSGEEALSDSNRRALRRLDDRIRSALADRYEMAGRNYLEKRQCICLSVPTEILDISHQHARGEAQRRALIDASVATLLDEYPHLPRDVLAAFMGQARANCYLKNPKREQMYLWGPPGTGKTRFAHRLAKSLQLPMEEICLRADDLAFLSNQATAMEAIVYQGRKVSDREIAGPIVAGMTRAGVLNPLFFCDEADDLLTSPLHREALKKWFDPNLLTLRLRPLEDFEVDISRCTFIFAGNRPIEDEALLTRIKQVEFGPLERRHKNEVLRRCVVEEIGNYSNLGDEQLAALEKAVKPHISTILACDERYNIAGVRTASEVAREMVNFISLTLTDVQLRHLSVENFVERAFGNRSKRAEQDQKC